VWHPLHRGLDLRSCSGARRSLWRTMRSRRAGGRRLGTQRPTMKKAISWLLPRVVTLIWRCISNASAIRWDTRFVRRVDSWASCRTSLARRAFNHFPPSRTNLLLAALTPSARFSRNLGNVRPIQYVKSIQTTVITAAVFVLRSWNLTQPHCQAPHQQRLCHHIRARHKLR